MADSYDSAAKEPPAVENSVADLSSEDNASCCRENSNKCGCDPGSNGCCGACSCNGQSTACTCESKDDDDLCGCCGCCPRKSYHNRPSVDAVAIIESVHKVAPIKTVKEPHTCESVCKAESTMNDTPAEPTDEELGNCVDGVPNVMTPEAAHSVAEAVSHVLNGTKQEAGSCDGSRYIEELQARKPIMLQDFKADIQANLSGAELSNSCEESRVPSTEIQSDSKASAQPILEDVNPTSEQEAQKAQPSSVAALKNMSDLQAGKAVTGTELPADPKTELSEEELRNLLKSLVVESEESQTNLKVSDQPSLKAAAPFTASSEKKTEEVQPDPVSE